MRQLTCKRVESILHEHLEGSLSEEESSAVEVHLAVCESCKQGADLWSAIASAAREADLGPPSRRLERNLASPDWSLGPERPSARRRVLVGSLIAVPVAAAAALVLVLVTGALDGDAIPTPAAGKEAAPHVAEAPQAVPDAPAPRLEEKRVGPGEWRVYPVGPGNALWLGEDAAVEVEQVTEQSVRFKLERGFALAEIQTLEPGFRFVVATPGVEVEARGTIFSVKVEENGDETVRVAEGAVEVRERAEPDAPRLVGAGEQLDSGAAEPRRATASELAADTAFLEERSGRIVDIAVAIHEHKENGGPRHEAADEGSPDELVARAHTQRKAGEYGAAAMTYQRVIERFPASVAAHNSLVALGQMKLSAMGRPGEALTHFEDYLTRAPAGPLAAEARVGSVRALARMSRTSRLIAAASEYLSRHPDGRAAAEVTRTRADAKKTAGDCKGALADYATVLKTWPGSAEASRARSGMDACLDILK